MQLRWFIATALILMMLITACQGPPPTQIVLVVTATPTTPETASAAEAVTATSTEVVVNTQPPTNPTMTPTLDPMPTPIFNRIQVAEQVFEHGRMFWVQPRKQIWVMIESGPKQGTWEVYDDTFEDGEPETDPSIVAPDGMLQPERGFGKLWRTVPAVREALGWAVTPEFGYVSNYEYHYGGSVNAQGEYVPGPGYHVLYSLYDERFVFNEADGTWVEES
ncbi:MAG: hypothetical protein H6672_18425 [Anaerolineaceae bacterium]|nr:hypothetical protein [Anaerolineaceae bacterium]